MRRECRKPSHVDRDLLLYALWTNGLRPGQEVVPLTANLAAHIMCEPRSTAAGRVYRLERDYGLITKAGEAAGRRKTPFQVAYSQAELDAIIASAIKAYNNRVDTIASIPRTGRNGASVRSIDRTQTAEAVDPTKNIPVVSSHSSVVSSQNAVASNSWNGQGKGKGKPAACSGEAEPLREDSTVIPLNDDAELIRHKLEPFGEHGHKWARELAQFRRIKVDEAIDQMERAARTYGSFNVIEAIREAVGTKDVKSPSGLFGSILNRLLTTHGKRDEMAKPKETNGGTYRPLTMQERTFYC